MPEAVCNCPGCAKGAGWCLNALADARRRRDEDD